ncbi:Transcription factor bHLH118 [Mucuna pruriens]|uniref:Transcription factor bHLH118 n=1 Tax=Mucuna pruriens TaxID=157652 RepID=A0A371FIF6_MUCPR|nr:Transcription factor bHLH118 [Mucuna pruriens]
MFPLQRGNELVIQFSNGFHPQHNISQDLILELDDHDNLACSDKKLLTIDPNKLFSGAQSSHANSNEHSKKMVHKEIERQRRQEMATLHASLRSLLPLQFIKGKRSISDQMNEAVNYINHLQKNIKEVSDKRDELKKKVLSINHSLQSHETKHKSSCFTVHQNSGGVGIEMEGVPLSKLLQLLLEEGLEVVSCLSTQVNGRLLHSVQCEVDNSDSVDLSELRRKFSKRKIDNRWYGIQVPSGEEIRSAESELTQSSRVSRPTRHSWSWIRSVKTDSAQLESSPAFLGKMLRNLGLNKIDLKSEYGLKSRLHWKIFTKGERGMLLRHGWLVGRKGRDRLGTVGVSKPARRRWSVETGSTQLECSDRLGAVGMKGAETESASWCGRSRDRVS